MFTVHGDDELRKLIKEEIKGQIIALTKEEIEAEVAEGLRRARGDKKDLEALIEKVATRIIEKHVSAWLSGFNPKEYAQRLIRETVDRWIEEKLADSVLERARKKLEEFDHKAFIEKALKNFKISV